MCGDYQIPKLIDPFKELSHRRIKPTFLSVYCREKYKHSKFAISESQIALTPPTFSYMITETFFKTTP